MAHVLVTGGAGFTGSHLSERLLREGHLVTCLDNLDLYYASEVKWTNISGALQVRHFRLGNPARTPVPDPRETAMFSTRSGILAGTSSQAKKGRNE